ncbi:MAG: hypothetical protein HN855_09365 [Anaerolineae bacterium]|nr:hypothetical protein [Anaerolineae bacterium]MBT7072898.1 hypothetical protein [Anaerolineae bacterium]MBT7325355.1 hypothetical protein [Anaerolineae bacterium]
MQEAYWIIPLSIIGFLTFWSFVVWLIAVIGGWSRLAKHYQDFDNYYGRKLRGKSGRFGGTSYSGVLIFGADFTGMYLAVNFFFRIGHPPLFIPWNDIQMEEHQRIFMSYTTLTFAQVPNVKLTVPSRVMAQVRELKTGNFL